MINDERKNPKMMPAICPQCGGQVEVDAQRENAFCLYCGMKFIVEKAIHTYHVQHATVEHVESININNTKESLFSFLIYQQKRKDEKEKEKKEEERKQKEESDKFIKKYWWVYLLIMSILMGALFFMTH
jgi:DNA-directed RNA polymerase subunit RPC12/RpoP